ncbi:helix-turn-helix domain-containing protein [Franconibacter helveticus]|uniref:helix-turn-helix domain-containing protein n=1 Tax=Franconibacter helveticus TaxID=357240 RepID=UPI000DA13705|nr:helix-turn-helix domain-containing protein [Franconibacter helveticus]
MVIPQKPLAEIYRLSDIFNGYGNWHRAEKNTTIPTRDGFICIIRGGLFSVLRKSDRLLIEKCSAPSIVGLARNFHKKSYFKVQADAECHYQLIPFDTFMSEVESQQCQQQLYKVFAWNIDLLCYREELLLGHNSYLMIKGNLTTLAAMDEFMRNKINVADYIVKRTNLSRSMVMKTLSQLRSENYVEIHKGKLTTLRTLPENL